MNTQKYREIGVAGCCGAVAGTAVAIVCDWNILMLVPAALIGAVSAFVCYNPREVASTIGAFGRDMGGAMRKGVQVRVEWDEVRRVSCKFLFVATCVFVGIGSAFLLPALLTMGGVQLPERDGSSEPMGMVVMMVMMGSFAGLLGTLGFCCGLGEISAQWPMPLTRRARAAIIRWTGADSWQWLHKPENEITKVEVFLFCLIGPVAIQTLGCLAVVALVLDAILTILLACASTERIAAILGAMLGLCVATLLHVCGVPGSFVGSLVILVAGGTVGWYAGPFLYHLRATLAREAAAETVRSL